MVWGTTGGNGKCLEEVLEPLGLISYGGGTNPTNGKPTYEIFSKDNDFTCMLDWGNITKIYDIYNTYLRKKKLNTIKNNIK